MTGQRRGDEQRDAQHDDQDGRHSGAEERGDGELSLALAAERSRAAADGVGEEQIEDLV